MKKLLLIFIMPLVCHAQQARCDWHKIGDQGEPQFIESGFSQDASFPLEFLITKCECRCNKEVVLNGTIRYTGSTNFAVFYHLFDLPFYDPIRPYFGQAYISISTSDWRNGFISINNTGQVFLTLQDTPMQAGSIIRITATFYAQ